MKPKHTPGPWTVLAQDHTQVRAAESRFVADCGFGPSSSPRMDEARANAHLIASAPELLSALEALIHVAYYNREDGQPVDAIIQARAAIFKAKGGAA